MKHLASICFIAILVTTIFSSCQKDEPGTTPIVEETQNLYEDILCSSVFIEGDYSSSCRLDTALPTIPFPNPEGNMNSCFYNVSNESELIYFLTFIVKNDDEQAQEEAEAYTMVPQGNETGLQSFEEISNLGDKAFMLNYIQESNLNLHDKALVVSNSNITFMIISQYDQNFEEPCSHSEDEMVDFAKEFIKNL